MEKDMEKEHKNGRMGLNMRDFGLMGRLMGKANFGMLMVIFLKESGKMIKRMDLEYICIMMERDMKEIGEMIIKMDME